MEIDKRAAIQMGVMVEDIPPEIKDEFVKIDTSLSSIHRFILALFKFYICTCFNIQFTTNLTS